MGSRLGSRHCINTRGCVFVVVVVMVVVVWALGKLFNISRFSFFMCRMEIIKGFT